MYLPTGKIFKSIHVEHHSEINRLILSRFKQLLKHADQQTHYFHGRFENIYIDRNRIPVLEPVLITASEFAAKILQYPVENLKSGFWFNYMQPGHITTAHSHDDDDELLSCVYYVDAVENSGNLILHSGNIKTEIKPEAGLLVFFHPGLLHEVSENKSQSARLSIAMNFGPGKEKN